MSDELALRLQTTFDINHIFAHYVSSRINEDNYLEEAYNVIKEKPKPFVKWVGGKRQLLSQFKEKGLYPPKGFNPKKNKYFEPFVGGGAVFFDLLPQNAILSDLNLELVTTYNVIKNDVESLVLNLKKHKVNKEYFLKIRERDTARLSDVEIASRFIYLNRTCFNGMYRVNKSGKFNVPFGKNSNPTICDEINLRKVSNSLKDVSIYHRDYKEVLKEAKKGDFIYFDPPYYPVSETSSFTSYTSESFLKKEQLELRDLFLELHKKGCYVMLSNSDTAFINEIYGGYNGIKISKVCVGRSINSNSKNRSGFTEVLVINY